MHGNIRLRPADRVDSATFVDTFNEAYRNYFKPLNLTAQSLKATVEREAIVMDASVVAVDGEQVVGTAMLGIRGSEGWIGGVGVVPGYRRQGIARAMMEYLLEQASNLRLKRVRLEVIVANEPAHALYKSLGFETRRRLLVLKREASMASRLPSRSDIHVETFPARVVLSALSDLDRVLRAWSRDADSLLPFAKQFDGYLAHGEDGTQPVGACLFAAQPFHVILLTLAGSRPANVALLQMLHSEHVASVTTYFNIPDDDPSLPELREMGYHETLAQFEMFHTLNTI